MKKITSFITFFVLVLVSISCSKDELLPNIELQKEAYGNVGLSFIINQNTTGKFTSKVANQTPFAVVISITDQDDKSIFENKSFILTNFNGSYLTESIELTVGTYKLTGFNVVNSANEVILSSPKVGSEFADLVTIPLPIPFTITENETINLSPEVLRVNFEDTPDLFGYTTFGFTIVETQNFYITIIEKSGSSLTPVSGKVKITYGDNSFNTTKDLFAGINRIRIPITEDFTDLNLVVTALDEEKAIGSYFGEVKLTTDTKPLEVVFIKTYDLIVNPSTIGTDEINLEIEQTPGNTSTVNVIFTADQQISRLYATKNTFGSNEGALPYTFTEIFNTNPDGSLDLTSDNISEFMSTIEFDGPTAVNETVEYKLWVTTGRGDFRDTAKRNAIGDIALGTIIIKGGETAPSTNIKDMKSFSTVLLSTPLSDGSSKSFFSLFNGQNHAISQGEEYASFWDFGYYFGATNQVSLASTANYPALFGNSGGNVSEFIEVDAAELNDFYIARSTMDFDSVLTNMDLDIITQSADQRVTNLLTGEVIEFVDAYGNKGLLRITGINPTFGVDGYISFDVKVQMN